MRGCLGPHAAFWESRPLPGAGSQAQSGTDVEYDPVNKLFLVGQPFTSTGASGSSIQVFDASNRQVDKGDVHLDRSDHALLLVSLPRLGAGSYKVVWRVVSVDTHVTNGSFTFRIVR